MERLYSDSLCPYPERSARHAAINGSVAGSSVCGDHAEASCSWCQTLICDLNARHVKQIIGHGLNPFPLLMRS